jgi:hypothetical protein
MAGISHIIDLGLQKHILSRTPAPVLIGIHDFNPVAVLPGRP